MTNKTIHLAGWVALVSTLFVSGCASCGSVLSSSRSCDVPLVVGAILAAPVAGPAVLLSNGAKEYRENRKQAENWRLLQAGDPATVAACVIGCDLPSASTDEEKQQRREVFRHGTELVISWWSEDPLPAQIPALMIAYYRKGAQLMKSDPAQADSLLRKAAAWSTDPRIKQGLEMSEFGAAKYNHNRYNGIVESIHEKLIILRYHGVPGRNPNPNILKDSCQAITAWPPAWKQNSSSKSLRLDLIPACNSAYRELFGKRLPDDMPIITDSVLDSLNT